MTSSYVLILNKCMPWCRRCRPGKVSAPAKYFAPQVPDPFLASSFTMCLNCEVLKGVFPLRTRYPVS